MKKKISYRPAAGIRRGHCRKITMGILCLLFSFTSFESSAQALQQLHGHLQSFAANAKPAGRVSDTATIDLIIGLPLRKPDSVNSLLSQLYDPASGNFHRYLDPEKYTSLFCPSVSDYQTLVNWAKSKKLTIVMTAQNRKFIHVKAPAAVVQEALHVQLQRYKHPTDDRYFYAPAEEPSVDLPIPVSYISGLNNYYLPGRHRNTLLRKSKEYPDSIRSAGGSGSGGYYTGNDFRAAYAPGVSLNGKGQTVGILELDGYLASDIRTYEQQYGLPNVPLQNVYLDGYAGASPNEESAADIELVMSMAPGISKAVVYGAPYSMAGVHDVLNEMANPTRGESLPNQITTSYYFFYDQNVYDALKQLAVQGQALFVASGDFGSYDEKTGAGAFPPADHPLVTCVGGTELQTSGPGGAWVSETTVSFSGGGFSPWGSDPQFALPAWQTGLDMTLSKGSTSARNCPDVAMVADNILVYENGMWQGFAGTSAAAPLWAGFAALVNQQAQSKGLSRVGFINPALYAIGKGNNYTSSFHDITTGNNFNGTNPTSYRAVTGYDLCTGWGTPAGAGLINALVQFGISSHSVNSAGGDPFGVADNWGRFHILYRDVNSQISDINYSGKDGWSYLSLSGGPDALTSPPAKGTPFAVTDQFGTLHALYRDANNHIADIYYQDKSGWKYINLSSVPGAPGANGNPYGVKDKWGTFHTLYRDVNNQVADIYFQGSWKYANLSSGVAAPAVNGDLFPVMDKWGTFHVLYRDISNHIADVYYQGSGWKYINLSSGPGARAANGNPYALMDKWGTMHILYSDVNNHISDIYYQGNGWKYVDLSAGPGAPAAAGNPFSVMDKWGTFHTVYRDVNNQVADIYFQGSGWKYANLSSGPGAPATIGNPFPVMDQWGTFHVLYRDVNNQVSDIYYQGNGWKYTNESLK